jgi:hypothetical protein
MYMVASNAVMGEKLNMNFSVPAPVHDEFRRISLRLGVKRQWIFCSIAALLLIELPEDALDAFTKRVAAADTNPKDMDELIRKAREGALLDEVEAEATPDFGSVAPTNQPTPPVVSSGAQATPETTARRRGGRAGASARRGRSR